MYSDSEEDTAERHLNEDAQRLSQEELTDVHFTFEIKTVKFLLFYIVLNFSKHKSFFSLKQNVVLFQKLGSMSVSILSICVLMCVGAVGAHVSGCSGRHSLGFKCVSVGL